MVPKWQMQNNAPALALTLVAIGAVCRSLSDSSDIGAHLVSALAALAAIIALSVLLDSSPKKGKSARSPERSEVNEAFVLQVDTSVVRHGYIKRFSQRNGWGLISCEELAGPAPQRSGFNSGKKKRGDQRGDSDGVRRDVRVYRADMDAQQLKVGSAVLFRAVPDREAPGWLKAVEVRQHHEAPAEEKSTKLPESPSSGASRGLSSESTTAVSGSASIDSLSQEPLAPAKAEPLQPDSPEAHNVSNPDSAETANPDVVSETLSDAVHEVDSEEPPRPATTAVVARRLVHTHLQLPLSQESRAEERNFWKNAVAAAAERRLEPRGHGPHKDFELHVPDKSMKTENAASENQLPPKGSTIGHNRASARGPSDKATDSMRLFSAAVRPVISQAAF